MLGEAKERGKRRGGKKVDNREGIKEKWTSKVEEEWMRVRREGRGRKKKEKREGEAKRRGGEPCRGRRGREGGEGGERNNRDVRRRTRERGKDTWSKRGEKRKMCGKKGRKQREYERGREG